MYVYRVGSEPGAARTLAPDFIRAKKLGWVIRGSIQLERGKPGGEFLALKEVAGREVPEYVAGDLRRWVAASGREAFEEFIGLFLPEAEAEI